MISNIQDAAAQLKTAITQFIEFKDYSENGKKAFKEIQKNIVDFGKTPYCLDVSFYILQNEKDDRILYFASLLLKNKLKFDFDQIDPLHHDQILQKIMKIINKHQTISKICINNLSLCLVFFYIHCSQNRQDMLSFFKSTLGNLTNQTFFLKSLQFIVQQVDSSKLVIDQQLRNLVGNRLIKQQQKVLIELNNFALKYWDSDSHKHLRLSMLQCFKGWIEFEYDAKIYNSLHNHNLYQRSFQSLNDPVLSDTACEVITEILNKIQPEQNPNLFESLSVVTNDISKRVKVEIKEGDLQIAQSYIKILCDFGFKAKRTLLQNFGDGVYQFLKDTIDFLNHDLINCFETVVDFWIVFIQEMKSYKNLPQKLQELILEVYQTVCQRTKFSMSLLTELNKTSEYQLCKKFKAAQDLKQRREWALELFHSISQVVGKQKMINIVFNFLNKLNTNGSPQMFWPYLQIYLFSSLPAAKSFPKITEDLVNIIRSFQSLNPQYVIVRRGYLRFFKALMNIQDKNPDLIKQLLFYIGQMFNEPLLSEKAQKAFEKACDFNPELVSDNIQGFFNVLKQNPQKHNIMKGIIGILKSNKQLMKKYLPYLFNIYIEKFQKSISPIQRQYMLRLVNQIVKSVSQSKLDWYENEIIQMFKSVKNQIESIFKNPINTNTDQDDLVQIAVRFLKIVMRAVKQKFKPYLESLLKLAGQCFRIYPLCSFLYLFEVSVTVYGHQPNLNEYFRQLFQKFCQITFTHLSTLDKIQRYTFLIDDYIGMIKRLLIYNAKLILKSNQIQGVFQLCQLCSKSQIDKTAKSAYCLYQVMFVFYWTQQMRQQYNQLQDTQQIHIKFEDYKLYEGFKSILWEKTQSLVQKMIQHLNIVPSISTRDSILDALIAQVKAFPQQNIQFWQKLLPNIPNDIWTKKEKQRFLKSLVTLRESNSQKDIRKLFRTMDKRFANRRYRQKLK